MGVQSEENHSEDFWGDKRVLFITERIRCCYTKLPDGGKFQKLFQTAENR